MTSAPSPADGVSRFIADLEEQGHEPTPHGDVVRYFVVPVAGRYAGKKLETGVHVSELQGWPTVPPHWMHLPEEVTFALTNADAQDCAPGWRRHSRETGPWAMTRKPLVSWVSHVRGMLSQAI